MDNNRWNQVDQLLQFALDIPAVERDAYLRNACGADHGLVAELKRHFTTVKHAKPPASRKDSSEWYVVAQGFKGARGSAP